jgi:catechol 2,3-dioxygenase-like lactoylglutathione lyase family enzyme
MATAYIYDHTHYKCSDPEATAQWFLHLFGGREVGRRMVRKTFIISTDLGGTIVNFSPPIPGEEVDSKPARSRFGVYHVCFSVTNLDARVAELKAKGAKFTVEPTKVTDDLAVAFLEGPDGISVELLERLS